ncbi:hypothetical protein QYE76_018789 [Lolium multiflorum]|uniref:CCHC-type domain-containing protein n=1 Tax=Lolium multiflorum TaxID=4521 RepID=A0AAD8PN51_LOLMU|nr:hypothetical protein QYE76_018789 [Lolium multiflorum]
MTRARVKALHEKVNSLLTTLDLDTPLDGLLPRADVLCVIRYKAHQDLGEEDTPRSGEGEEQRDAKMDVELDPESPEERKEEKMAGRSRTRSDRPPDRATRFGPGPRPVPSGHYPGAPEPRSVAARSQDPGCPGARPALSAPSTTWVADTDIALLPHHQARCKTTTPMSATLPQAPSQGIATIINLVAPMLVMKTLAPTLGEENSIAMLVLMSVLHKNKCYNKIVITMIAMPTMGMTTNPKTKVLKINLGVISGITLVMIKTHEETRNMSKMRWSTMGIVQNIVKTFNISIIASQVKLVCINNANPMLWLKFTMPKFKGEEDPEAYLSWALKVDKIFRIHNYSGAKKVAMASLEFEDYANTWWEQVLTLREEKGEPPIDTWEDMKKEMQARFVPTHYMPDLFNKIQKLKQGTKTIEEFFKEMELTMMRANIQESENQTIARFFNGLNYPIKRIVEFQPYSNMVELVHQATKAERQVNEDIKYSKAKSYFTAKLATTPPTTSVKPTVSSTPSKQPTIQSRMKQTVSSTASSKASTGPSNVTCFKCGTQGHKSFECKNTKVMITMENGDIETLSEGEYEALVQATVANDEDYDEESAMEDQRCNIFQTRAGIGGKSIKVIIDGGSCHNLASTELCEKLDLTLRKHPHPYHIQWLSDKGNVKIQHTVTVHFKIGPYEETIECDVVPMTVCHMLLGRPWQYDKKAIHDGLSNTYTFKVKDTKFELRPMTPSQVIADNAKALARAQAKHIHHSELSDEGVTHKKESERHKLYMSERKSVLLATKNEWREVQHNPSTILHYMLICKGPSAETNDLTNIPSSLLSLLKEFQDVFPTSYLMDFHRFGA